jgi:hypothetical protein
MVRSQLAFPCVGSHPSLAEEGSEAQEAFAGTPGGGCNTFPRGQETARSPFAWTEVNLASDLCMTT